MFTPPPSPLPLPRPTITDDSVSRIEKDSPYDSEQSLSVPSSSNPHPSGRGDKRMQESQQAAAEAIIQSYERKKRSARRTRWAVLFVPVVLIFVAVSSRHISMFDIPEDMELKLGSDGHASVLGDESLAVEVEIGWREGGIDQTHEQMHHHHYQKRQTLSLSDPAAPSSSILITSLSSLAPTDSAAASAPSQTDSSPTTTVPQTEQTIPPVPDSSNPPALPTPFPQPFDTTGSVNNLTTQTCANFFTNMTQTVAFRSCRPFSLLEQFSNEFIEAQTNLTLLNTLIFGTCDTTTSLDDCISNMDWFASSLSSSCSTELGNNNAMVRQTLLGLQSYALLRTAACLTNQQSNTYCYASAAHASSPADLYLYQLPLGIGFPVATTQPSCSTCAKSLLGLFADAVKSGNSSEGGLGETYDDAAQQAESVCGSGFATVGFATTGASSATSLRMSNGRWSGLAALGVVIAIGLDWL